MILFIPLSRFMRHLSANLDVHYIRAVIEDAVSDILRQHIGPGLRIYSLESHTGKSILLLLLSHSMVTE